MIDVTIAGRIDAVRQHAGTVYTRIIVPTVDPYSRPDVVEVRSNAPLGVVGSDVRVDAGLRGYVRKPYKYTDPATGEIRVVVPVEYSLTVRDGGDVGGFIGPGRMV